MGVGVRFEWLIVCLAYVSMVVFYGTVAGAAPFPHKPGSMAAELRIAAGERLSVISDETTGVRIGIPTGLVGAPHDATHGRNWKSRDGRLEIDTLRFRDRTLKELHKSLRSKKSRSISREDLRSNSFVLEGADGDDTTIYVTAEAQGEEIRGVSIVYSNRARNELRDTIEAVKRSFIAFPVLTEPVAEPPVIARPAVVPDPVPELQKRLTQVENLQQQLQAAQREKAEFQDELARLRREKEQLLAQIKDRTIADRIGLELPVHELPAAKRVALVVGVNRYANLAPPLKTAVNDAVAVGKALKSMDFLVLDALDPDRKQFYSKWDQFLKEVDGGATAAFFFAGHGIQIAQANYLLPADVASESADEDAVRRDSLSFNELRDELQTRRPGLALFILDACRNNPYRTSRSRALSLSRGLAHVSPARGSFIMYSAEAGEEALDHLATDTAQETNSVFVRRLVPLLATNMTLQSIAQRVRADVQAIAGSARHVQTPAYYDGLVGLLCLPSHCSTKNLQAQNASR
jgi:Caspase domain